MMELFASWDGLVDRLQARVYRSTDPGIIHSVVTVGMAGANSSGTSLDAVTDTVGERTTAAFEILGNNARGAILSALWEAQDPGPPPPTPPGIGPGSMIGSTRQSHGRSPH